MVLGFFEQGQRRSDQGFYLVDRWIVLEEHAEVGGAETGERLGRLVAR